MIPAPPSTGELVPPGSPETVAVHLKEPNRTRETAGIELTSGGAGEQSGIGEAESGTSRGRIAPPLLTGPPESLAAGRAARRAARRLLLLLLVLRRLGWARSRLLRSLLRRVRRLGLSVFFPLFFSPLRSYFFPAVELDFMKWRREVRASEEPFASRPEYGPDMATRVCH
jgi:hypothetical protein